MRRLPSIVCCLVLVSAAVGAEWSTAPDSEPAFTADGKLKYPEKYREWIYLSSGLDMSYSARDAGSPDHSMFDNVFVEPSAYREFARTGTWPDGTQLALEVRAASGKGSINEHGKFQTDEVMRMEVHVKDLKRFQGGWAFFGFRDTGAARMIPTTEDCYSCHQQHAALDTTFVQFYPTLLRIATLKGTLSPGYKP
jgi:cytochrome P460